MGGGGHGRNDRFWRSEPDGYGYELNAVNFCAGLVVINHDVSLFGCCMRLMLHRFPESKNYVFCLKFNIQNIQKLTVSKKNEKNRANIERKLINVLENPCYLV